MLCALIAASAAIDLAVAAEAPLRIVVGFPPGGVLDILARVIGQRLAEAQGRPVIVDNQPGAGNLIAAQAVARAQPDNTTILLAPVVVPAFFPHPLSKDVLRSSPGPDTRGGTGRFQSGSGRRAYGAGEEPS
jgi:tripartite-type tricarboxylate transporter receptor subunit TctC